MTEKQSVDQEVLGVLAMGAFVPFDVIAKRVPRGLDKDAVYEALSRLVAAGTVTMAYGRGYMYLSPYDTGHILEPKVWDTNGRIERFGRVDFDNDEGATEVTVWVQRGKAGPIVHVVGHTDDVAVWEEWDTEGRSGSVEQTPERTEQS